MILKNLESHYKNLESNGKLVKNGQFKNTVQSGSYSVYTLANTDAQYKYYQNLFFSNSTMSKTTTTYTGSITVVTLDRSVYKNYLITQGLQIKTGSTVIYNRTVGAPRQTSNTNIRMTNTVLMSGSTEMGALIPNYGTILLYGSYPQAVVNTSKCVQVSNNQIYFIRGYNSQFNNTDNGTYTNNGYTYITSVGLYDINNNLLAVARLSKPLKKDSQSQINIKLKLVK